MGSFRCLTVSTGYSAQLSPDELVSDKVLSNLLQAHIETLRAEISRIQHVASRTFDEVCRDELVRIHQSLANALAVLKVDANDLD
jgi:hypothetical protein